MRSKHLVNVLTHRVGVRMTAKMADGFSAHFWRMGTEKATVLPEPVLLPPMQSLPLSSIGMLSL